MFYKTYSFILIFMCHFYIRDVFADILISDNAGNQIFHITADSSKQYENFNMTFVNVKEIFAEICLNYKNYNSSRKNGKKIELQITFKKDCISLCHKKKSALQKYHYDGNNIKRLESFIQMLDNSIEFKVVKINSNLNRNTHLINDTIYDKKIKDQLEGIQKLSSWNYVKNDIIKLYSIEKSYITLEDLINNSTTYKKTLQSTIEEAKNIMFDRSLKYVILLSVYAYEILIIQHNSKSYWGQLLEVSDKINKTMLKLDHLNFLSSHLDQLKDANHDGTGRLARLKGLIQQCASYFLTHEELKKYDFQYEFTVFGL
ncbi:uncharacterized protein LOC126906596 isoform X2 [Daktulosphaira vitifoliae]|uniref:uncharacterized protein LOC126906596 isoform X2 n=1 Tax=Daktulosphaira vitifoliae TaxID=58002 RepID=UPI0021AAB9B1|nr:uncharacterized protein LOC126906596 isoform X2 [Daktulosphaira vitifoliae]